MHDVQRLQSMLKHRGFSMTKPRRKVFELLSDKDYPLSVVEIRRALPGVDSASVYRIVDLFERVGIAQRVWFGFKSKVELSEHFSPHHHHFTCSNCHKSIAIDDNELEQSLHNLEKTHGFIVQQHSVELSGLCQNCRR